MLKEANKGLGGTERSDGYYPYGRSLLRRQTPFDLVSTRLYAQCALRGEQVHSLARRRLIGNELVWLVVCLAPLRSFLIFLGVSHQAGSPENLVRSILTSLLSERGSDSLQPDWNVGDDGSNIIRPSGPEASTPLGLLYRVSSRASTSTASIPQFGILELSLADVCKYIDANSSLQVAEIVSTECYTQSAGAVTHRFVLLELRRPNRRNAWLRLDRRRGKNVSILKFLIVSGITAANDRAQLATEKSSLIEDSLRENRQEFQHPPSLLELARLLRIVTEEILKYRIWPENCWFFCSLIQEHLGGSEDNTFVFGGPKYNDIAPQIRLRVLRRVWKGRGPMPALVLDNPVASTETSPSQQLAADSQPTLTVVASAQTSPLVPHIFFAHISTLPEAPSGLKHSWLSDPEKLDGDDTRVPVFRLGPYLYTVLADIENNFQMYIVAWDASRREVKRLMKKGARYIWRIEYDANMGVMIFFGQANYSVGATIQELVVAP
ncbi:hypothetical protein DL93DRAFT_2102203 [Clavulina sp. PMI_390]|nr:hypothetical protein DL93DRAFT_2102203 [Clavulina sp. PMI_390]